MAKRAPNKGRTDCDWTFSDSALAEAKEIILRGTAKYGTDAEKRKLGLLPRKRDRRKRRTNPSRSEK